MPAIMYQLIGSDGVSYPLGKSHLTIGSRTSNDLVIRDERISGRHAQILVNQNQCWIRDEQSRTGTFVNGQRVVGQQELHVGDEIQIGPVTFQLATILKSTPAVNRSKRGIVFVGLASVFTLFLILILAGSGWKRPRPIVTIVPTLGITHTRVVNTPLVIATLPIAPATVPLVTPTILNSATPFINASIMCEDLDQFYDIHPCTVTNLGNLPDTFWLSFDPHRLDKTNDFNISIKSEGQINAVYPDRGGWISLGRFEPNEGKTFSLRMICVNVVSGCRQTTIRVQLLADDGNLPIASPGGALEISNIAFGITATPTEKTKVGPSPTRPTVSVPTFTSTPSDAVGPTPTP